MFVTARPEGDEVARWQRRLRDGLEESLSLVIAKSVLALLELGVAPAEIVRTGLDFGTTYRAAGWGAGLTVLIAMANVIDELDPHEQAAALIHALAFVARDTAFQPPRFPVAPLSTAEVPPERLSQWYRRFIDTRSSDAAERVLATALAEGSDLQTVETMMLTAVTDHVFVDEGHTLDFTNKAFEAVALVGDSAAPQVLPTLVPQTARSSRSEESGEWRHPHDLATLVHRANEQLVPALDTGRARRGAFTDVSGLAWQFLADDPEAVVDALLDAARRCRRRADRAGARVRGRLRITRFHTQNDFGDWDTVHHSFTTANALHHAAAVAVARAAARRGARRAAHLPRPVPQRARGPSAQRRARRPRRSQPDLGGAGRGRYRGNIVYGYLRDGGDRRKLVATSARPCSPRTSGSTGTRCSRPRCASRRPGRPTPRRRP